MSRRVALLEMKAVHNAWVRYAKGRGINPSPQAEEHGAARFAFVRGWIAAVKWERGRHRRALHPKAASHG